jgi:hypothetical protein
MPHPGLLRHVLPDQHNQGVATGMRRWRMLLILWQQAGQRVLNTRHLRFPSHRNSQHVVFKMGCINPGKNVQQTKFNWKTFT